MKHYAYLSCLLLLPFLCCNQAQTNESQANESQAKTTEPSEPPEQTTEIRDDFKKFYDERKLTGSFVLYDQKNNKYVFYNQEQSTKPFTPASTFKICNSLIALETGIIPDENYMIKWDSIPTPNPNWNKDQDMKAAFKNSTVWYYKEVARRVGEQKMKYWLDTLKYGNADISGGIDQFWLLGGLRITPMEQIDLLQRLHDDKLPFSKRSMAIVKRMMAGDSTATYMMRAKTGWGAQDDEEVGWFVGYIETKDNVYYFANCVQTPKLPPNQMFAMGRVEIAYKIFEELGMVAKK